MRGRRSGVQWCFGQLGRLRLEFQRSFFLLSTSALIWGERGRGGHTRGSKAELTGSDSVGFAGDQLRSFSTPRPPASRGIPVSTQEHEQPPTAGEGRTSAL